MTRAILLIVAMCSSAHAFRLQDQPLEGPDSVYTALLADILMRWPASRPRPGASEALQLTCVGNPSDDRYVGVVQQMTVAASLSAVEQVLDDVPRYKDLLPGVVDVHVRPGSQNGNRYVTVWEQAVPVFFLPNITYELANLVDKTNPRARVYRYKLLHAGSMLASDGMVVLEALGSEGTRYTEYDFFNAQWGPLPASAVWGESLRGAFTSDMAIKLRAENPQWSVARIVAETGRRLESESERLEQCYRQRHQPPMELRAAIDVASRREARAASPIAP